MSINTNIEDGAGSGNVARVTPSGAILVQAYPAITSRGLTTAQVTALRLYREFFRNAGSSSMVVAGSLATPIDFTIAAAQMRTKWVTGFRINIESDNFFLGSNDYSRFGAVASALTNGIEIFSVQSGEQTPITQTPVRTSGEFLDYADNFTNFSNAIGSQGDYLQVVFRLDSPIVLPDSSQDRIVIRIQDNLTTRITTSVGGKMTAIAQGYQEST